jgi:hypothetical protein
VQKEKGKAEADPKNTSAVSVYPKNVDCHNGGKQGSRAHKQENTVNHDHMNNSSIMAVTMTIAAA